MMAAKMGHTEIAMLLIENGAKINAKAYDGGATALFWVKWKRSYRHCTTA